MGAEVGVAVIGFGLAGRVFHAPFVSAVPGLRLLAIVQRTGDTAAQAWPGVRILRSAEEAFSDPAVQLVVVATPNETHFTLARTALESGKHVVIDKPFAATSEEARTLIELAAAHRLLVAPFHNRRWDGDYLTLKKIIAGGTLGRVVTLESTFDRFRPLPREGTWKEVPGPMNGLLMDLAPHLLDQGLDLFGTPRTITASVRKDRDVTAIEDAWDITLTFDRVRMLCRASMLAAEPAPRFLLHGTRGSYRKLGVDPQEPALVAGAKVPRMGSDEPWLPERKSAWGESAIAPDPSKPGDLVRSPVPTEAGDYRHFYAGVRDAIGGTAPLPVPSEAGYQILKLIELARESSAQGRTLEVRF